MKYRKYARKREPLYDALSTDGPYQFQVISDFPDAKYKEKLYCKSCDKKFSYEAMEFDYRCPDCGSKNVRPVQLLKLHDCTQKEVEDAMRKSWESGQYPNQSSV